MTCGFVVTGAGPARPAGPEPAGPEPGGPEPGGWQLGVIMAGGVITEPRRARTPDDSTGPVR